MNQLDRIVHLATPSTGVLFRKRAYGKNGVESFLRHILALANASVEGPRYIITGAEYDARGRKNVKGVNQDDFSGKPAYETLVVEHIEPPLQISYQPATLDGKRVGVFEVNDCRDRPYMMRVDHSETLRRGDAYLRVNDSTVKMGRRQLQSMFERQFQDSVSASSIEVGFPGRIVHKDLKVPTRRLAKLPSSVAGAKLQELIKAKSQHHASLASTIVARLTHARLFGSDCPYEHRSVEELIAEVRDIEQRYGDHDDYFLYEKNATAVQLVIYNQGDEPIRQASYSLVLPSHDAFHVARRLPKVPRQDDFAERPAEELAMYPMVTVCNDAVRVSGKIGDISPGEPVEIFSTPLRLCVGSELKGRRFGLQYTLQARNLRSPAKGTLRLLF